ncbi:hypothetical protein BDZ97DRAFT_1811669 [Flammula alnicola]|nr:hypothetical protein BDZ97DRAFT_1811669 [Flammula alnicola]
MDSNVHIAKSTFDRMLKESYRDGSEAGFERGFADAIEKLKAKYDEETQQALVDISERAQESRDDEYVHAFEVGLDLPSDDDIFFTPSAVDVPLPLLESFEKPSITTSEVGLQTSPSVSSIPLPTPTPSLLLSPVPISSISTPIKHAVSIPTSIPQPSSEPSWADDSNSIPIIQLIKPPRDLSCLRSERKPFSTIRHRNRRCYRTARRVPIPPVHFPVPRTCTSRSIYPITPRYPHLHPSTPAPQPKTAPFLPPALDWDCDPRLSELSRVLQTLGWVPPSTPRP